MSFKRIAVYMDASPEAEARLAVAAALAKRFEARLIGVAAGTIQPPPADPTMGDPEWLELQREQIREDSKTAEAKFRAAPGGAAGEWRSLFATPALAMTDIVSTADLAVIGPQPSDVFWNPARLLDAGEFLMRAGRPALVVPKSGAPADFKTILVTWKNTSEARRAVADALPLLKTAESVTVAHVKEGSYEDNTVLDCKLFLEGHGIKPVIETLDAKQGTADRQLPDLAGGRHADLIVAGAYGHSRLREWALGGVTRQLITQSPVPCFFSH